MTFRAIVVLGMGQCVSWGVLYYAFAALVLPLQRELGVSTWVITGAFSLALLMSAALAPAVGRWADRGRGALVMQAGGFTASGLLVAWTLMPGVPSLYLVWAGLGLCMAATLYEPAFIIAGRAHDDPTRRLRALAAITLFGGLASTVFLPLTAVLVNAVGWRSAVAGLAAALTASTFVTRALVFRDLPGPATAGAAPVPAVHSADEGGGSRRFAVIAMTFSLASLAAAAFTTNLVPALAARGIAPATAAMLGGLLGVMQLPGRALLITGMLAGSPVRLLALSLFLQAGGFTGIALAPSTPFAAGAITLFALGAGLATLVRPHLLQTVFGFGSAGYLNGRIARQQQLARAAGPLALAWLAGRVGYATVFSLIAGVFVAVALASAGALGRPWRFDIGGSSGK